jgi:hypothetical protein
MKLDLSAELINFFLDVDIVAKSHAIVDESHVIQRISYNTNEFCLEVFLRYKRHFNKVKIDSEISEILSAVQHPCDRNVIDSIIILFCLSDNKKRDTSLVVTFFSLIKNCKVKQYLFFNARLGEEIKTLKFHEFYIGSIDYDKFYDFVKLHTTSNYAEKYKANLSNKAGIEIKNFEINIVDICQWLSKINATPNLDLEQQEMVNIYLDFVSRICLDEFKNKFHKQQEFINAYFGLYYDLELFDKMGYEYVSIYYNFLNNSNIGWVLPISTRWTDFSFPDPRIVANVNSFLFTNGKYIYQIGGEFSRYLETMSNIFSGAEKHLDHKNFNNSFIDYFVGLDFLLAPDTEKSKKLKQRISLLVFDRMSTSFEKQLARLDYLYDIRSLYVHRGINVMTKDLIELRNIARIVLSVLIEMVIISYKNNKIKVSSWLHKIDELVQGLYKGKRPKDKDYSEIGIKEYRGLYLQSSLDKWDLHKDS